MNIRAFRYWIKFWNKNHGHIYGLLGIILAFTFYLLSNSDNNDGTILNDVSRVVPVIESPISFVEFAKLTQEKRQDFFIDRVGKEFIWEGYITKMLGFDDFGYSSLLEKELKLYLTPTKLPVTQLNVEVLIDPLIGGDADYEMASELNLVVVGQRLRMSGYLKGSPEHPILKNARLEEVFPIEQ